MTERVTGSMFHSASRGRCKPGGNENVKITPEPQGEQSSPCRCRTVIGGAYFPYAGGLPSVLFVRIGDFYFCKHQRKEYKLMIQKSFDKS